MLIQLSRRSWQRFLFLLGIVAVYTALLVGSNYLRWPNWWDENSFWKTSLTFSDRLIPTLDQLRDYRELSTPLPFMIYGALEHLFQGGIFAGRLFNFVLSIGMSVIIGYPHRGKGGKSILCLVGLLLCPYYLWLSGRLYTDIIASFFVLMGFLFYNRDRHLLSGLAFVLGIASRQYVLAFPTAIAAHELISILLSRAKGFELKQHVRWIIPSIAASTILGWFYLFNGLAPSSGLAVRSTPEVQQATWALTPGSGLFFLAIIGLYFVIPEFILFESWPKLKVLEKLKKLRTKHALIAAGLLVLFVLFPPSSHASGNLIKLAGLLPADFLKIGLFYVLAVLTCWRFSRLELPFWIVLFSSAIMMKAHPWDRYVLPLVVAFWYLKSVGYPGLSAPETSSNSHCRPNVEQHG